MESSGNCTELFGNAKPGRQLNDGPLFQIDKDVRHGGHQGEDDQGGGEKVAAVRPGKDEGGEGEQGRRDPDAGQGVEEDLSV